MDLQQIERALQVRYIKLHFGLYLVEDSRLPMNKVSAIRGGIGEMLLSGIPEKLLPILLAGEILHIGKNTSFGFGRYHIF